MSRALLVFLLLLISVRPAHAIAVPPAALDEQSVVPACLTVRPSYIFGQEQVYGTDGKGPAVRIENGCAEAVTIDNIQTGAAADKLTALPRVKVNTTIDRLRYHALFVQQEADCTTAEEEQRKQQAEREKKIAERKAKTDTSTSADDLLEKWAAHDVPPDVPYIKVACKKLTVNAGDWVTIAMPWETAYLITGTQGLKIAGQMINPLDVTSPETFQFAQSGDKTTRYMLALHNIETGQNLKIALRWLNEAAEEGYRPALYQLAQCYETGKCGVAKNAGEALFWRTLADPQIEPDGALYKRIDEWQKTHPEVRDY